MPPLPEERAIPLCAARALLSLILLAQVPAVARAGDPGPAGGPAGEKDPVVARVNGVPLFSSSLSCACDIPPSAFLPRREAAGGSIMRQALEQLIDLELLFQEGMRQRYPGLADEVERRFQAEAGAFGTREQFLDALRCGELTEEGVRRSLLRNLVVDRYLNSEVYSGIQIDSAQITAYYSGNRDAFLRPESARVQHILLRVRAWSDAREVQGVSARAEAIRAEAEGGADFASLARRFSQEPASAGRGGEWGVIPRGSFGDEFDQVIFSLPPGGVGRPISSHLGFHIVKVLERKPAAPRPLAEVKGEIVTLLRKREAESRVAGLLERLRRKAKIEILLP